jgi:hypothetical protein
MNNFEGVHGSIHGERRVGEEILLSSPCNDSAAFQWSRIMEDGMAVLAAGILEMGTWNLEHCITIIISIKGRGLIVDGLIEMH